MAKKKSKGKAAKKKKGKKRTSGFTSNSDKMKKRAEEFDDERGDDKYFNPRKGMNKLHVGPPWSEEGVFYKEVYFHYPRPKQSGVVCPKRTFGKSCPICDKRDALKRKGQLSKDMDNAMKPKPRAYMNVLDMKKKGASFQVFGCPPGLFRDLLEEVVQEDVDINGSADESKSFFEDSHLVTFRRRGIGSNTRYKGLKVSDEPDDISGDVDEDLLDSLWDLDGEARKPSKSDLKKALRAFLRGLDKDDDDDDDDDDEDFDEDEEDEDDDEDDDDDEDEDDDEDDDDEDEDEDEDEEEDEDEDDDDEDYEPKKRKKKSKSKKKKR